MPILPCTKEAPLTHLVWVQVFLGASAVLSNGTVMSRAGSAAVAMMAYASSKPVLICCETYKFHEKVQLDSITANELGDPEALIKVANRPEITALQGWEEEPRLGKWTCSEFGLIK